jgi:hypothetical protein
MNKHALIAMLAVACLVVAAPELFGQVKTQQAPTSQTAKPISRPDGVLKAKCDLVAVSIEFVDLKSFDSGSGKRYSCKPAYTFKNAGPQPSGTFDVIFEIQNPVTKEWYFYLTMPYQASLAAGETRRFGGQPVDECGWAAGAERPKFRLRLDFNHLVTESNEDNNELVRQVSLMELRRLTDLPVRKIKAP